MGSLLKLLLVALLTLPAGAFVVGWLSAEPVGPELQRAPVVLEDPPPAEPAQTITGRPETDDEPRRSRGPRPVEVIGPPPTELDDEAEDGGEDADEHASTDEDRDTSPQGDDRDGGDRELADRDEETEADEPDSEDPEDAETAEREDDGDSDDERDDETDGD